MSASARAVVATNPLLAADLAFAASLPPEHFAAFCAAARELLRSSEDAAALGDAEPMAVPPPMLKKAAKALSADVATVSRAVRALCYVLVDAATAGRPAEEVLQGVDELLEHPAGSRESLAQFYSDVAAELEQETRKSLDLPRYRGLEWRLQVTLAGRYAPRQTPQPSFLLRLHTSAGGEANASRPEQHLLQADLATLRRITSELSEALAEDKSKHSRRIARRL